LPPPNLEEIRRNSAVTTTTTTDRPRLSRQHHHSVAFSSVVIREYDQTIGDNPSVSYGPPISLDWEYTQLQTVTLEHYEAHRPPRRSMRQMCMNYYTYVSTVIYIYIYYCIGSNHVFILHYYFFI
jgi:hypothetical protein